MIALVDYGLGNIRAFTNVYARLNIPVVAASTPEDLLAADRIILPGVGSFDWAMTKLNQSGMRDCLDALVQEERRPALGVCVGMQMMARESDEGELPGLGWIDAGVRCFHWESAGERRRLPHMGWNDVQPEVASGLFAELEAPRFYFLHSYYMEPNQSTDVIGTTQYGGVFASAVRSGNVYGTQFHPEKSHDWGIRLLKNYAEL